MGLERLRVDDDLVVALAIDNTSGADEIGLLLHEHPLELARLPPALPRLALGAPRWLTAGDRLIRLVQTRPTARHASVRDAWRVADD